MENRASEIVDILIKLDYLMKISSFKRKFGGRKNLIMQFSKQYNSLIEAAAEARQIKERFEKEGIQTTIYIERSG